jgi:PGF-pre-PGF domain-containing protein
MMNNKVILSIFFIVIMSSICFATASVSTVTTSASASTVTTGTNVVLTSISTADTDTVSNVQIRLVKDSGSGSGGCTGSSDFLISDPASPYYYTTSVSTSGTTKTFTFTVGTCGTYTYYVSDSWSGGSKSSTPETIEFIAPTALQVQSSDSSKQLYEQQSFNLTIDVTNSQASQVTSSYSFTVPSGLSASGDPTSGSMTINPSSTTSLTWSIRHSTCFTGSKAVTFQLGDNTNASYTVISGNSSCTSTVNTSTTTTSSSPGSSSTTSSDKISLNQIPAGMVTTVSTGSLGTAVSQITLALVSTVNRSSISISSYGSSRPSPVSAPSGLAYQYILFATENISDSNIQSAKIKFNVTKSWLTQNNISYNTIVLMRYSNGWTSLSTSMVSETSTIYEYEATTPGFSYFVIVGIPTTTAQTPSTTQQQPSGNQTLTGNQTAAGNQTALNETSGNETLAAEGQAQSFDYLIIIVAIIIISVGIIAFFFRDSLFGKKEYHFKRNSQA